MIGKVITVYFTKTDGSTYNEDNAKVNFFRYPASPETFLFQKIDDNFDGKVNWNTSGYAPGDLKSV